MTQEVDSPKSRIPSVFFTTMKTTSAIPDLLTIYLLEELLKILPAF
jgi:hypothetical protein